MARRRRLQAAKACQMSDPAGYGSGGDRCVEATSGMIIKTYFDALLVALFGAQLTAREIMFKLTEAWNAGSDVSALENFGVKFPAFLQAHSLSSQLSLSDTVWPGFATIMDCIDRGHVAVGGFDNYAALRLADGSNPYHWTDPPGLGHVLIIVGYDLEQQTVIVHDPLRAEDGQPADYSWKSFQAAGFHDCTEIVGARLPYVEINFSGVENNIYGTQEDSDR